MSRKMVGGIGDRFLGGISQFFFVQAHQPVRGFFGVRRVQQNLNTRNSGREEDKNGK